MPLPIETKKHPYFVKNLMITVLSSVKGGAECNADNNTTCGERTDCKNGPGSCTEGTHCCPQNSDSTGGHCDAILIDPRELVELQGELNTAVKQVAVKGGLQRMRPHTLAEVTTLEKSLRSALEQLEQERKALVKRA